MKSCLKFFIAMLIPAIALLIQACTKPEKIDPTKLVFGEMRNGEPTLAYPDYDRLKKGMSLAFPEGTPIDTVYVQKVADAEGNFGVYLTAIGLVKHDDGSIVPVSANFRPTYHTGTVTGPIGLVYCTPVPGCPGCIVLYSHICSCTDYAIPNPSPGCLSSMALDRNPKDVIEAIWTFLASDNDANY